MGLLPPNDADPLEKSSKKVVDWQHQWLHPFGEIECGGGWIKDKEMVYGRE